MTVSDNFFESGLVNCFSIVVANKTKNKKLTQTHRKKDSIILAYFFSLKHFHLCNIATQTSKQILEHISSKLYFVQVKCKMAEVSKKTLWKTSDTRLISKKWDETSSSSKGVSPSSTQMSFVQAQT